MLCVFLVAFAVLASSARGEEPIEEFRVIYQWSKLDFTWPDDTIKAKFLDSSQYIPENTTISGVKVWHDRLFLTLPRWRKGVPATLVSIAHPSSRYGRMNASPKLEPFPSWEMQQIGNCTALQNVQNVEIHPSGQLWVIDSGRVNTLTEQSDDHCPPKLVVFELVSPPYDFERSQGGYDSDTRGISTGYSSDAAARIVRSFVFSDTVISLDSLLVDIVLDTKDGDYAYISDASESDPGLIVYSWKDNRAWKVRDDRSMKADPTVRSVTINGMYVTINRNIAGLALSPVSFSEDKRRLFYSPLGSYSLFSLPASVLKDENRATGDISGLVKTLGRKTSISEGMVMDSNGVLYYGLVGENAITKWDTKLPFHDNQYMITRDNTLLQWPAGFGFDSESGNLIVVSNRLQNYLAGRIDINEDNFRIMTAYTGRKSYLYASTDNVMATSTQTSDRGYNEDRSFHDHDHREEVIGDKDNANNAERMLPAMTIILLAVAKVFLA